MVTVGTWVIHDLSVNIPLRIFNVRVNQMANKFGLHIKHDYFGLTNLHTVKII